MIWLSKLVFYKRLSGAVLLYRLDDYPRRRLMHPAMGWVFDRIATGAEPADLVADFRRQFPGLGIPLEQTLALLTAEGWLQSNERRVASTTQRSPDLTTVNIRLTNRCNFRCQHCFPGSSRGGEDELPAAAWLDLLEDVAQYKPLHVTFTGGEPFLVDGLFDCLDFANERGMLISLCTNASLITPAMIERLRGYHFASFKVSLDGTDAAAHEAYRGRGTFARAVRQIGRLVGAGLPVCINTVISRLNIHQVPQMVPFMAGLGATEFAYDLIRRSGRARDNWDAFAIDQAEQEACLRHLQQYFPAYQGMVLGSTLLPLLLQDTFDEGQAGLACGLCVKNVIVVSDGVVAPCWRLLDHEEVAGSVGEASFHELWASAPVFGRVRSVRMSDVERCGTCRFSAFCDASCRGHAFDVHHEWLGPPDPARCDLSRSLAGSPYQQACPA